MAENKLSANGKRHNPLDPAPVFLHGGVTEPNNSSWTVAKPLSLAIFVRFAQSTATMVGSGLIEYPQGKYARRLCCGFRLPAFSFGQCRGSERISRGAS